MRIGVLILCFSVCGWATLTKDPVNCSSRPCTYTITCATADCDATEKAEVQTALDDAHLGDTVKLEAGRRFLYDTFNDPLEVTNRTSGTGYLLITTTKDSELPPEGTRITPAYEDVVPWIGASEANTPGFLVAGDDTDVADHIKIVGVGFDWGPNLAGFGPLLIGYNFPSGPQFGHEVTDAANQPDDIIVDRCLFLSRAGDHLTDTQYNLRMNCSNCVVKNSYFEGAMRVNGGETQTIYSPNSPGPNTFTNNYIGAATENLFFGAAAITPNPPSNLSIKYNYLPKIPARWRYEDWPASTMVFKGKMVRDSGATLQAIAQNTGTTGSVEPTWPAAPNTVVDNEVTWAVTTDTRSQSKNNFEIKSANVWDFSYNVIDGDWVGDGSQYAAVALKLTNTTPADCVPYLTGTVNTDGTTVTHVSGGPLPRTHHGVGGVYADITINSVGYTVSDFERLNANQLTLTTSAGTQSGVTYEYGTATCDVDVGYMLDGTFAHNVIRNAPSAMAISPWHNGQYDRIGNLTIKHNLFHKMDCTTWSDQDGTCGSGHQIILFAHLPANVILDHNTMLYTSSADNNNGINFAGVNADYPSDDTIITNNIWTRGDVSGILGDSTGEGGCWASGTTQKFCDEALGACPASQWNENIIAGVLITNRYDCLGDTENLCATDAACTPDLDYDDPTYGKLFTNTANELYVVDGSNATIHFAKRGGSDGQDIGADYLRLPLIRDVQVTPTDDKALVEFWVHPPIRDIPCVIQVKTGDYDFDEPDGHVADLDPDTYSVPESSDHDRNAKGGLSRMFVVGANSALSASTKHYYRIMCGGDAYPQVDDTDPSFTTLGTLAGTTSVAVSYNRSGSQTLEYGTAYSRATDTISAGGTDVQSCSGACEFSFTATRGEIYYYRLQGDTDALGNKLPPETIAVQ